MRLFLLMIFFVWGMMPAHAASGGKGNGAPSMASTMQSKSTGGGGGRAYLDPRAAPPLTAGRKVNEQDCRKPVDPSAGNLRCK